MTEPDTADKSTGRSLRGIVMIMCDQLPLAQVGFGGGSQALTPNLDRLASQSVSFTNAHVASPTCMPNRATIATGRWPSAHGTRTNGLSLDPNSATFMGALRASGWTTGASGKLHFQAMGWPFDPAELSDIRTTGPLTVDPEASDARPVAAPSDWYQHENLAAHRLAHVDLPPNYYGFDRVDLVVGHGDRPSGHYERWARALGHDPSELAGHENGEVHLDSWNEVWKTRVPAEAHPSTFITEKFLDQLNGAASSDAPFFLMASYPDPHHPFCPPDPYFSLHQPHEAELPRTFRSDHSGQLPHLDHLRSSVGQPGASSACWAPDEPQMRAVLAAHLGQLTFLDHCVGRILDEIDRLGLTDEVAVVFTSDHGDMMGEHGLLLKQTIHYRAVTSVPILVRSPGLNPSRIDSLVSSADIAPTILDLAGVKHFRGIQGRSLTGAGTCGHEALLVEEEHLFGVGGLPAPIVMRSIITADHRLTVYPGRGLGELYDLGDNPAECHNHFDDPGTARVRASLHEALIEQMTSACDRGQAPTAAA